MVHRVHVSVQRCCRSCFRSIIYDHYIIWEKKTLKNASLPGRMRLCPWLNQKRIVLLGLVLLLFFKLRNRLTQEETMYYCLLSWHRQSSSFRQESQKEEPERKRLVEHFSCSSWWWWFEFSDIIAFSITEPPHLCPPSHTGWALSCSVRYHPTPTPLPSHSTRRWRWITAIKQKKCLGFIAFNTLLEWSKAVLLPCQSIILLK